MKQANGMLATKPKESNMNAAVIFAAAAVSVWSIFKADKTADWSVPARFAAIIACVLAAIIPATLLAISNGTVPGQGLLLCAVPLAGAWQVWRAKNLS